MDMNHLLSKILERIIFKKLGIKVNLVLYSFNVKINEDSRYEVHLDATAITDKKEVEKLLEGI